MTDQTPTPTQPGDDLTPLTDDQLRDVIRTYGLNSSWWGSADERTLADEVALRDPYTLGLKHAADAAATADVRAAREAGDARSIMTLTYESAGTKAVRAAYQEAVQRWLDGLTR